MKQIIKGLTQELNLNGKTHLVPVSIIAEPSDERPDFDYGNEEDNKREMDRFESGELVLVNILVKAKFTCEQGLDSLGQCFVRASHYEQDILETVKDYSMVENAMNDLKENVFVCYNEMKAAMGSH